MKRKVLTVSDSGIPRFDVVKDDSQQFNQYRVYRMTYDCGWHRKQIAKYADLASAIAFIHDMVRLYCLR